MDPSSSLASPCRLGVVPSRVRDNTYVQERPGSDETPHTYGIKRSKLESPVQGDDPGGEIEIIDALKAGARHHLLERFLVRMHAN